MNDEVKEILIDLIDYYNVVGTADDPGFVPFAAIIRRASKALERAANNSYLNSGDVDPYAMDVVGFCTNTTEIKREEEW